MAKKKKSKRRRSPGFGGGRWGVNLTETAMGAGSSWFGEQIRRLLPGGTPTMILDADAGQLGLYALGVIFRNKSARSFGAGGIIGSAVAAGGLGLGAGG